MDTLFQYGIQTKSRLLGALQVGSYDIKHLTTPIPFGSFDSHRVPPVYYAAIICCGLFKLTLSARNIHSIHYADSTNDSYSLWSTTQLINIADFTYSLCFQASFFTAFSELRIKIRHKFISRFKIYSPVSHHFIPFCLASNPKILKSK